MGFIPKSRFMEQEGTSIQDTIRLAMIYASEYWDELVGQMRVMSSPVDRPGPRSNVVLETGYD